MANITASLTVICTQNVVGSTYVCIFEAEKNQCGGKDKVLKLGVYTVLIWYFVCSKDQLLMNTTHTHTFNDPFPGLPR